MKYEASPRQSEEFTAQVGPSSVNVQRLFEAHTIASKKKQVESLQQKFQPTQNARPATIKDVDLNDEDKRRVKSADAAQQTNTILAEKIEKVNQKTRIARCARPNKPQWNAGQTHKENIPIDTVSAPQPLKSKMWIRPKSCSQLNRKTVKKNDPVSLYQSYQKDWEKFKSNICESSHSDLRWSIREKMMGNR